MPVMAGLYHRNLVVLCLFMVTTPHLLTGAVIGYATGDIVYASVLSFAVHYLLDAVPHACWKPVKNYKEAGWRGADKVDALIKGAEPALGIAIVAYFASQVPSELLAPVLFGAFFGWFPDLLTFLEWGFGWKRPYPLREFELRYHRHLNTLTGVLPQVAVSAAALYYMFVVAV